MTERLYYRDGYLQEFTARVVDSTDGGRRVYLDRTAFYPSSGGQPFDTGTLGGARVIDVIDEEDRVAHIIDVAIPASEVAARIDWPRRFDHMQQHTGQHLPSAVLEELFHVPTVSFHLGAETSTIDLGAPSLSSAQMERAEERCAEVVSQSLPVQITFEDEAGGLRKATGRTGTLRIVSIGAVDRSACGGTHVRTTAEIGPVLLRGTEKMRGHVRLEFVCGRRALVEARADFRALGEISRRLSVPPRETPALVAANVERIAALEKSNRRLAAELAQREGRELWDATRPDPDGIRRFTALCAIDDAARARAQAFVSQGKAVFVAISEDPPTLLVAASPDSGIHAGDRVKAAVGALGGRGGGNQALAQGSVPAGADTDALIASLIQP